MGAAIVPILGGLLGSVVSGMFAPKQEKQEMPAPQTPTPAPQDAKAADSAIFAKNNAATASANGPSSTLLTGLMGVPNSSLNLGKNVALGQ